MKLVTFNIWVKYVVWNFKGEITQSSYLRLHILRSCENGVSKKEKKFHMWRLLSLTEIVFLLPTSVDKKGTVNSGSYQIDTFNFLWLSWLWKRSLPIQYCLYVWQVSAVISAAYKCDSRDVTDTRKTSSFFYDYIKQERLKRRNTLGCLDQNAA